MGEISQLYCIDGLAQGRGNAIANTVNLLRSCIKPLIYTSSFLLDDTIPNGNFMHLL